jgi:amino acid adenylation domain-containing protein
MSELLTQLAALSLKKRKASRAQAEKPPTESSLRTIFPRRAQVQPIPLSYAQERLWFLDQLEPANPSYNISNALRLKGPLAIAALTGSLSEVVRRHEVLRTTFSIVEGSPVQAVSSDLDPEFRVVDLDSLAETDKEKKIARLAVEEARRCFDLSEGPLVRASLLRLDKEDDVLLFTMHHIVSDGWSVDVFVREMSSNYEAMLQGRPPSLDELPIQYADFAIWQREWLKGEVLERQLDYWTNQLSGSSTLLNLPTDRPRPAVQGGRGATRSATVADSVFQDLLGLCHREGVTMFMLLMAAFKVLLHRHTSQEDINAGTPIANRRLPEVQRLIGFFANTLVIRTRPAARASFRHFLADVRRASLDAYEHQDLPFEHLVDRLRVERSTSHSPLFQAMFVYRNAPKKPLELTSLDLTTLDFDRTTAKFDLLLSAADEGGLKIFIEYSTDILEHATIARMIGHYGALIESIAKDPDARLQDLSLLTSRELDQLLFEWNDTGRPEPETDFVRAFETRVEIVPDSIALVYSDQVLTYRCFNERANRLARYLMKIGVGPESVVAVFAERSFEMMIGLLAVLKTGAAYLPIDAACPRERLAVIIEEAAPAAVITQSSLAEKLPHGRHEIIDPASRRRELSRLNEADPVAAALGQNRAYVIYTSGSTGRPKGVVMPRRALSNLLAWQLRAHPASVPPNTLQFPSISFDVSFQEIFSCWLAGGRLILISESERRDPDVLLKFLADYRVERIFVPFVMLQQLAEASDFQDSVPAELTEIMTAGEQLQITPAISKFFLRLRARGQNRGCKLSNHYGPTESHVATAFDLPASPDEWPLLPPIGKPIDNFRIHLTDEQMNLVPAGVVGELYIGGIGLARGYLRRPNLTAERFVPDPFSRTPGERLYRTGDLARYLADGCIDFLGRKDHQVKIRGFRVELGEIEGVLARHPAVNQAVVLAKETGWSDKRLVAYVVAHANSSLTGRDLRDYLGSLVPDYMTPSQFIFLDRFPLTPSGKVDRKLLPSPDAAKEESGSDVVLPRSPIEALLLEAWSETLARREIGIHDDFFDLGGHSLSAVRLMWGIGQRVGKRLPVGLLFQARTVAGLAELLAKSNSSDLGRSILVTLKTGGARPPLFCVHPAGGQIFAYRRLAELLGPDQPVYGLQSRALDDPIAEFGSIKMMAAQYAKEICNQQPEGPYHLLGWSVGGVIAHSIAGELEAHGMDVAFVGLLDSYLASRDSFSNGHEPLEELSVLFGSDLSEAFAALRADERQAVRDELEALSSEKRIDWAIAWGQERGLLPGDLTAQQLQSQFVLAGIHARLLRMHTAEPIRSPLYVWRAQEGLSEQRAPTDWSKLTHGETLTETAQGNHFTMLAPRRCGFLVERLHLRLAGVSRSGI